MVHVMPWKENTYIYRERDRYRYIDIYIYIYIDRYIDI